MLRETGAGSPYLDHAELERALRASQADAAWVGWGFVAEDAAIRRAVRPARRDLHRAARRRRCGCSATRSRPRCWPSRPACRCAVERRPGARTSRTARRHAGRIGYPLILKARSGGGGRGIRIVSARGRARGGARAHPGRGASARSATRSIFMEQLVEGGRHIEVQVIADNYGNVWAPGVRDCSIQRRNQKVIEESSSPALTPEQDVELRESRIALVQGGRVPRRRHRGVPLPAGGEAVRLPRGEHPAAGRAPDHRGDHRPGPGEAADHRRRRAAGWRATPPPSSATPIEARLNAEDADHGFAPVAGQGRAADACRPGPGVRVDTGIARRRRHPAGLRLDDRQDHRLGPGPGRGAGPAAGARCATPPSCCDGGTTTKSFLLDLLDRPEVVAGTADTGWLDRAGADRPAPGSPATPTPRCCRSASTSYDAEEALERDAFLALGPRRPAAGRPRRSAARWSWATGPDLPPERGADRPATATGSRSTARTTSSTSRSTGSSTFESRLTRRRPAGSTSSPSPGRPVHLVEVDGVTPPGQPGRGRRGPRARAGGGGRGPGRPPAHDVEAGETVAGPREHEDGDAGARRRSPGRVREILAAVNSQVDARRARCCASTRSATRPRQATGDGRVRRRPATARPATPRTGRCRLLGRRCGP